jgi:aromatic-L-amino-acid/L-tryptophan decarboxylase
VIQCRDWGIPLGRRFRALKLWFHLRLEGVDTIRARLRRDLDNAQWFRRQVEATAGWAVLAPVPLQTVCIRHTPTDAAGLPLQGEALDAHTLDWVGRVNASGEAFLTPSLLDGRWMARVSIGVESTQREHVTRLWQILQDSVLSRV